MIIGGIFFAVIACITIPLFKRVVNSAYERKGIEEIFYYYFGNMMLIDSLAEEMALVSYDY